MAVNQVFGDPMKWSTWEKKNIYIERAETRSFAWEASPIYLSLTENKYTDKWEVMWQFQRIKLFNTKHAHEFNGEMHVNLLVS